MLIVELNEFSVEFLRQASASQVTPTLDKILNWPRCETNTQEKTERHGLDPWVQWVSIHTGVPAQEHGVAHLAEAEQIRHEQIWDHLNDRGISSTVWGAMNGKNNHHSLMDTFFPDPWTFSQVAQPAELNRLLALPRLYAQDYVQPNVRKLARSVFSTGFYLLTHHFGLVLKNLGGWFTCLVRGGFNNAVLFALFDNLSAKVFRKECAKNGSDFKLIFLNSIAHLQHHDWLPDSAKVQAVVTLLENTLASVLDTAGEQEAVLVANAFSQVCTTSRNEYLYRPVDPQGLMSAFHLRHSHVEQMMTNDGHIFFDDAESCAEAHSVLSDATVGGNKAFDVDRRGDTQLFYQFILWDDLDSTAVISINSLTLRFYDLFEKIVLRTGSHVSAGDIFYTNTVLPERILNHDLFNFMKESYV